jgi:GNAT superfamily N-acetyltransferase
VIIRRGRLEDAHGIAQVHVRSWQSTYRGILPDTYLAALSISGREQEWREHLTHAEGRPGEAPGFHGWGRRKRPPPPGGFPPIVLVADAEGAGIVGFAEGGSEREGVAGFDGELNALYLLKEWQRQGVGRRLVQAFAGELIARGLRTMIIWVLAANSARGFYQAIGGEEVARELELVGTSVHEKVAYGWRDLTRLADAEG